MVGWWTQSADLYIHHKQIDWKQWICLLENKVGIEWISFVQPFILTTFRKYHFMIV